MQPPPERSLPSNLEAERSVLVNMILEPPVIPDVLRVLRSPDDFYDPEHAAIFRTVLALYSDGTPVDCVAVGERLRADGCREVSRFGGKLDEIMEVPHFSWNAVEHAAIVRQKAVLRGVMEAAEDVIRSGYANEKTADDVLADAMARFQGIAASHLSSGTATVADTINKVLERFERRQAGETFGVPSGLRGLDEITDGFQPQELILLGARASMGKTSLGLQVCEHVALDWGKPALFVSLEMNEFALSERALVARSAIPGHKIRTGQELDDDEMLRLGDAVEAIRGGAPLHVLMRPSRNVVQITNEVRAVTARHKIGFIAVDYIQLIDGDNPKENEVQALTKVSGSLKALARDLDVPILVLSQLNRALENREDKSPRMADLRGSGSLEQDADLILLLHRPEYFNPEDRPGMASLIVAKNRNGRTGSIELVFRKELMRFEDYVPRFAEPDFGAPAA